jgi:hypothetical protein
MNGNGTLNQTEWTAMRIGDSGTPTQSELKRVLLVGRADYSKIFDCLLSFTDFRFSLVADYRGLWAAPPMETLQLAILFDSLHSFELEASCRLIRRKWPKARILIFRSRMESLDKSLYDVRLAPNVAPQMLQATTLKLAGKQFRPRGCTFRQLHGT